MLIADSLTLSEMRHVISPRNGLRCDSEITTSEAEPPNVQVARDNLTSRSIRGKIAAMWTPLNGQRTLSESFAGACGESRSRARYSHEHRHQSSKMLLFRPLAEERKRRRGRGIAVDRISPLSAMLSASHSSFRSSGVTVTHRKWRDRPCRVIVIVVILLICFSFSLFLCLSFSFSLPLPAPLFSSVWCISRNPSDVRVGSGFVFFVPRLPFSKRALKEKQTSDRKRKRERKREKERERERPVFRSLHGNDRST